MKIIITPAVSKYHRELIDLMRERGIPYDYEVIEYISPHEYVIDISEEDFNFLRLCSDLSFIILNDGTIRVTGPNGHEF